MPREDDFSIGGFLVQPTLNRIVGADDELHVNPKAMAVLLCLAERPGDVFTKEEILARVWPESFVTEEVLPNAVWELRKAFGDDAKQPRVIQTIHRKGYRLLPAVGEVERQAPPPSPAVHERAPPQDAAAPAAAAAPSPLAAEAAAPDPPTPVPAPLPRRRGRPFLPMFAGVAAVIVVLAYVADQPRGLQAAVDELAARLKLQLDIATCGIPGVREGVRETRATSVEAWDYLRQGRAELEKLKYTAAIDLLGQATAIDRGYAYAYESLAYAYLVSGKKALALDAIEQAVTLGQQMDRVDLHVFERRKAQILGDVEEEFRHLQDLNSLEPQNDRWHFQLGWFYQTHRRDCEKARERYQDAIGYAGGPNSLYQTYYGMTLLTCGRVDEAIEVLETNAAQSGRADTYDYLGYAHVLTGDYERGQHMLERAAQLDPELQYLPLHRGELAFARGRYRQASEQFEEYRSRLEWPNDEASAYWHLAQASLAQGRYADAVADAEQALKLKPDALPALWVQGLARLRMGEAERAGAALARMELLRRPESLHELEYYHHLKGELALAAGRPRKAVGEFQRAVELRPENPAFFQTAVAAALAAAGDLGPAEAAYQQVFRFNPNDGRARCGLAALYDRQGRRAEAAAEYRRCAEVFGEENGEEPLAVTASRRLAVLTSAGSRP